jgi:hypothetical protein
MAGWSLPVDGWWEKQKDKIKAARTGYAINILNKVIDRTPVNTGAARANWKVILKGHRARFNKKFTDADAAKAEGAAVLEGAGIDDVVSIKNNAPYINMLEYGGYPNPPKKGTGKTINGFSTQAPNGIVGVALAASSKMFADAVIKLRGKERK